MERPVNPVSELPKKNLKRNLDTGGEVRRTPDEQTRKALKADTLQNTASRDLDLTNPTHVEIARQRTGLPLNHQRQLEPIDFRVINDIRGTRNCFDCSLAAARRRTVTELYRTELNPRNIYMLSNRAPTIEYIVNLYREAGFTDTQIVFQGVPREFEAFLNRNLRNGELAQFSLASYSSMEDFRRQIGNVDNGLSGGPIFERSVFHNAFTKCNQFLRNSSASYTSIRRCRRC